jgi:omega-hydroxy-beta-dihydromenaquinone-9 sulfotransferase
LQVNCFAISGFFSSLQAKMFLFVTGNSRSGTTMMSRILGNHAHVFTFQELHFFDELVKGLPTDVLSFEQSVQLYGKLCAVQRNGYFGDRNPKPFLEEAKAALLGKDGISQIALYQLFCLNESKLHGKSIPCKQTPQNIFSIAAILEHIPESKIIIMVRDPREVLLSQKNKWKRRALSGGEIPFWESVRARLNYHPVTISRIWNATFKEGLKYENHPAVKMVYYEQLIGNPEQVIAEVSQFCDINYSSALLDIPVVGSSNFQDAVQVRGVDTKKMGQWNKGGLSDEEIQICEAINSESMSKAGYALSGIKGSSIQVKLIRMMMPVKLGLALFFNLKRLKNLSQIRKKIFGN